MNSYKYDTHVHTSETSPCGRVPGTMGARMYKEAGYHGIVITDHYFNEYFSSLGKKSWEEKIDIYLQGYKNAYNEGQKIGLNVILGMELRFSENYNDYLVYGIDEAFLKENPKLYELNLKKFKERIKGKDILVYQAHPFRSWVSPADPKYLDGAEVFNGCPRQNSRNHRALRFAQENHLRMISGSDFHQIEDVAIGGIVLPEAPVNSNEFYQLLFHDRIIELLSEE